MAPKKRMIFQADVNRIYDEEYQRDQQAQKEKLFVRPSRKRKMKNAKWFGIGMGIDLPFCIILLRLLVLHPRRQLLLPYQADNLYCNRLNRDGCDVVFELQ